MAVLENIRNRAGLLVGIIGFALFAFVLGDLFSSGNSFFRGRATEIGEINGNSIQGEEFQRSLTEAEERLKRSNNMATIDEGTRQGLIQQIWNDLIDKYVYQKEFEKLGVGVHIDELFDMVQGDNISPQVSGIPIFKDSITGEFDRNNVIRFLQTQLTEENDPEGVFRDAWAEFEQQLMKARIKTKYNNLISKGLYVTTSQAKAEFVFKNELVGVKLIGKRYDVMADSTIKVEDADLKKYYDENKHEFEQNEETRKIEYVVFQINPTSADRAEIEAQLAQIRDDFQTTENDTAFVNANSASPFQVTQMEPKKLAPQLAEQFLTASPGQVFGPYTEDQDVKLAKFVGFKAESDSVKARHILISTQNGTPPDVAKAKADSLMEVIKKGGNFAELAKSISEDPGSGANGGDLGYFTQGTMVPEFNDACFNGKVGDLVTVVSQFGAHLINIQEKTKPVNKYQVVYLTKKLEPSSTTMNNVYAQASEFAVNSKDPESFKKIAEEKDYFVVTFETIRANDRSINDITNGREIVQWAYNNELNSVSKVFDLDDKYVVAVLTGTKDKGIPTFDQLKETIRPMAIREKKASLYLAEFEEAKKSATTINQMAEKMSLGLEEQASITLNAFSLLGYGQEYRIIGNILGAKENTLTGPLKGKNAVFMIVSNGKMLNDNMPEDLTSNRKSATANLQQRVEGGSNIALTRKANIVDKRYKFF
jgi:peptidyl-prolyl cis-trans isomerase D